jgi:hypothetical protein
MNNRNHYVGQKVGVSDALVAVAESFGNHRGPGQLNPTLLQDAWPVEIANFLTEQDVGVRIKCLRLLQPQVADQVDLCRH